MANSDLHILLAEDNEVNQHLMLRILGRIGYDAVLAKTGIQVLNKMDRQDFDIILMDIQMPEMDGLTATKLIRAHYAPEKQPRIIALTAESSVEGREKYLEAGMDDVLTKPVQIDALVNILANLSVQTDDTEAANRDKNKSTSLNEFPILEETVISDFMALMGDDGKESAKHLVELFKSGTPGLIEQIENASDKKDKDELLRALHTLKGSTSQVGGRRMEQFCARLEILVKQSGVDPFATFITGIKQEFFELRVALDDFLDK
ncbi:MAG: response regulator, partial [Anaerolineaceae bacterium]